MNVLFRKSIEKKQIVILILCLFLFPWLIENKEEASLLSVMFSSHYVALVLNNLYIWIMYTRIFKINTMFDKIITRCTKKEFFKKYIIYSILSTTFYLLILYFTVGCIVGTEPMYAKETVIYFFIQMLFFTFLELFGMMSFDSSQLRNQNSKMVIPFFLNLIYHYVFVINILVKIWIGG